MAQIFGMGKFIFLLLAVVGLGCGCHTPQAPVNIAGAYDMVTQTFGGNVLDTTFTQHKQLKLYTGRFMMYVRLSPADSLSSYGVGTYTISGNRLVENIVYSAADTIAIKTPDSDTMVVTQTADGMEQARPNIRSDKGDISLKEVYHRVDTAVLSPIDGCWKQVSGYSVKGTDTVRWADVQYKAFFAGNFAFGNVETDKRGITHAGVSYGTFTMAGNTVNETITASSWPALNGQHVAVEITVNSPDVFTQTIRQQDGTTEVLRYERLRE